jgi:L-iditol 2-dehydrogenase
MKAVVKYGYGPGKVELRDTPEPEVGPGLVKLRVKAAGICGSDLHAYHEMIKFNFKYPVIVGHEFAGDVAEVGEGVEGIEVGERVTSETTAINCGVCEYCRTGYYNMCLSRSVVGYDWDGGFTSYCVVPQKNIHKLPESVDYIAGALTEPLACCIHGVTEQTGINAGDLVLIVGPGPIGLLTLQVALAEGGQVVICGTSQDAGRLKIAEDLGADYALNVEETDVVKFVGDLTGGYGADIVLECSGAEKGAQLGIEAARKRGKYTQMGLFGKPITLDFERIAYKELQVTGFLSQKRSAWQRALKLEAQGKISPSKVVSHQVPIDEWKRGYEMSENKEALKAIIIPE